jgi:hypothetical protein
VAVRVTQNPSTNTLEFRLDSSADTVIDNYLAGLPGKARGDLAKSSSGSSMNRAKAQVLRSQTAR